MIGVVIDIVLVIVDTDLIACIGQAGILVLFAVFAVPFDADGVIIVVALLSDGMARIGKDDVAVFIVNDLRTAVAHTRLIIVVGIAAHTRRLRTLGKRDHRIDDLTSRFVLILLDLLVLPKLGTVIDAARRMIRIEAERIQAPVLRVLVIFDGRMPRLFAHQIVIIEGLLVERLFFAAVPERRIRKELIFRQRIAIVGIVIIGRVLRAEGHDDGEQDERDDDDRSDNGTLILAEAAEGIVKVADGLCNELLVMRKVARLGKPELFLRDMGIIRVFHVILPPFVFSGR